MNISDERRLKRMIEKYGESSRIVSMFRDQIAAQERGQSAQDMYITGMMKRKPENEK